MSSLQDSNIVKIAVEKTGLVAQLIEFDQNLPLVRVIQDLCTAWGIVPNESGEYSLQFSDNAQNYITEKNRPEIKNGSILRMTKSAAKTAQDILESLNHGSVDKKRDALINLTKLSSDFTFAMEFINKQGHALLIKMVETGNYAGELLAYTLQSFVELMDHGIVSWDILEPKYIQKIASYVNDQSTNAESKSLRPSLAILESLVMNSSAKHKLVEKEVTLPNLIMHLQANNQEIQQYAIALINALFIKADDGKQKCYAATLSSRQIRVVILTNILQSSRNIGAEMAHQLYVLQTLLFNLLEERKMKKMESHDQDAREKILELRKIAFDLDGDVIVNSSIRKQGGFAKDYKKLGFRNNVDPAKDFLEVPPGMLALDCMIYFARNHTDSYTKVVLENSSRADEHECPFGRTSIELTKLVCEKILKIGEAPSEQDKTYHPMFFTHDHPFEEFFCICIVLLNKTWKEMRATTEDFVKVFSVVKEQITRALKSTPPTLDKFRLKLASLTYSEITNLWQQERCNREEWESQARPIVELREKITPDIVNLIVQQRLGYLCEGTQFMKYTTKGTRTKDKFWYCRLSPNHKIFHYGECDETVVPSVEELPHKFTVLEIKALVTGRDCPHMKAKKSISQLAFSLTPYSEQEPLGFVAGNEQVFDYWTDGINALLNNKMTSKETKKDLETLLSMDIRLRLLDIEGLDIPENPPLLPKDPPNYDFCYEFK